MKLIESHNLKISFDTPAGKVRAVDDVDFYIDEGEKLVFIGETGSGKTVLGMTIMRLLPTNVFYSGSLLYKGEDLIAKSEKEMQELRGREMAIIMQNPLTALNPCLSIRGHLMHVLMKHQGLDKKQASEKAVEILGRAEIPKEHFDSFVHQLSGGLRQRAMIALGLSCGSSLLIADEPTKGLDVTVQMQIVQLLNDVTADRKRAMFIITHDLGVAAALADRIAIMYCGEILETGTAPEIFEKPIHPYTKGLIAAHPCKGLSPIPGFSPSLVDIPKGCVFAARCPNADAECLSSRPQSRHFSDTHEVRCCHADCK